MKLIKILLIFTILTLTMSCSKFMDVVPDNVPTLDNAFAMRNTAERYLFTIYSLMPRHGDVTANATLLADELWAVYPYNANAAWRIARGEQNTVTPILNYWDGLEGGRNLFICLRECNIFLENINRVPDMEEYERTRWIAEVKFLKAYYTYWLLNMYGPVPVIRENLPINAGLEEVKAKREAVDDVFAYIVGLIDEATPALPNIIDNKATELGRITKVAALAIKAKILVTAASPLFNGNTDFALFTDETGKPYFNQTYNADKWKIAAEACKEAIDRAHENGHQLHTFIPTGTVGQTPLSASTLTQLGIRTSVTARWNSESIWADPNNTVNQVIFTPRSWDPANGHYGISGRYGPPLKMIELFYTKNGVPINEDTEWDYQGRKTLKTAIAADKYNIKEGYQTVKLHFDREDRFYASIGFDGGIWYGQGKYDDNTAFYLMGKNGQAGGIIDREFHSPTGYWPKKMVHFENVITASSYTQSWYPWPVIRLADLYLLYSEALNEHSGPSEDVYEYLNRVRTRAGLLSVQESWSNFSRLPNKYQNQDGLRDIIQRERAIELMFEGHRFWDLRRWKKAIQELNDQIVGWNITQQTEVGYYKERVLFKQQFTQRNYLWPLREQTILVNRKLEQAPGW